jgi:predicted acylesterase/phospholipase RssA
VFFNNFDSEKSKNGERPGKLTIKADHVMASGALPPAFPPILINDGKDAELYWDGGVSTNTPIEALAEDLTADFTKDTLVFLIDLWDRKRSGCPMSAELTLPYIGMVPRVSTGKRMASLRQNSSGSTNGCSIGRSTRNSRRSRRILPKLTLLSNLRWPNLVNLLGVGSW